MLRSGRVPCDSHRMEPTMERSSDASLSLSLSVILLSGTESTGWPDRYGDFAGLASWRLDV